MKSSLSVVMPVHNGSGYLPRALAAILRSKHAPLEIIVVDDASSDGSAGLVETFPEVQLIRLPNNQGAAAARNAGAAVARGDVIVFVDADVVIHDDALSRIVERLEIDPNIDALMGAYDASPADGSIVSRVRNLLHAHTHLIGNPDAKTFWTGLGAVKRQSWRDVGGLPMLRRLEDVAFGVRLTSAGHRIALDPQIQGQHLKCWSLASMIRTDFFDRGLPWALMTLNGAPIGAELNTRASQKASVAASTLVVMMLLLWSAQSLGALAPTLISTTTLLQVCLALMAIYIFLNASFLGYVTMRAGLMRALGAVFVLMTYHLVCAAAGATALAGFIFRPRWARRFCDDGRTDPQVMHATIDPL